MGAFDDFSDDKPRKEFIPAPEGNFNSVCVDELDLGLQERMTSARIDGQMVKVKKLVPITELRWQIDERMEDGEKRYLVTRRYPRSLYYDPSKKQGSALAKDLMRWIGKTGGIEVDQKNKKLIIPDGFSVVGKPAMLTIVHNTVGDQTYANVDGVAPLPKGMKPLTVEGYTRVQDRDKTPEQLKEDEEVPF